MTGRAVEAGRLVVGRQRPVVGEDFVEESRRRPGAVGARQGLRLDQLVQPGQQRLLELRQVLDALLKDVKLLPQLVALLLLGLDDPDCRTDVRRTFSISKQRRKKKINKK